MIRPEIMYCSETWCSHCNFRLDVIRLSEVRVFPSGPFPLKYCTVTAVDLFATNLGFWHWTDWTHQARNTTMTALCSSNNISSLDRTQGGKEKKGIKQDVWESLEIQNLFVWIAKETFNLLEYLKDICLLNNQKRDMLRRPEKTLSLPNWIH